MKGVIRDFAEPERVKARLPLVVHALAGRGRTLVVSFAGVGTQRKVTPPLEFIGTASDSGENHVLFVSDDSRSWMNAPGLAEEVVRLVETYCEEQGIERVVALGNSMGGFAALILPELTKVDAAVAVSPQFSMHPDLVPGENRWRSYADRITEWRFPTVGAMDCEQTRYYVLHGAAGVEARHWLRFARSARSQHYIVQGVGHNLAGRLRRRRVLGGLLWAVSDEKPKRARRVLQAAFRNPRFKVHLRRDYMKTYPDLRIGADGGVAGHPGQMEDAI